MSKSDRVAATRGRQVRGDQVSTEQRRGFKGEKMVR